MSDPGLLNTALLALLNILLGALGVYFRTVFGELTRRLENMERLHEAHVRFHLEKP